MAIALAAASIKHERRVRLVFTNTLAAGAFTSLTYYAIVCTNSAGANPTPIKAVAVLSSPNVVELQLDLDLVGGGVYEFRADGVPAVDASATPVDSLVYATFGASTKTATTAAIVDRDAILYGIDLHHDGEDFLEDAGGDLLHVSGPALARRDIEARLLSEGLPWEPSYGVHAREWVDGAPGAVLTLRGRTASQVLEDDRLRDVAVTIHESDPDDGSATIEVVPVFIGDASVAGTTPLRRTLQN